MPDEERPGEEPPGLLLDANVLIDYCDTDRFVLALASRHQRVCVLSEVLDEVDQLDTAACTDLGITILDPIMELLAAAVTGAPGLSFEDQLSLLVAEREQLVLTTNDRRLRTAAGERGVQTRWGLEILLDLVERSELTREAAIEVAEAIHDSNPFFITRDVLARFRAKVDPGR